MIPELKPLTGKQRAFVEHYCTDSKFNATMAAMAAGYATGANNLAVRGNELLRNIKIQKAIEAYNRAKTGDITVQFVLDSILQGLSLAQKQGNLAAMARFTEQLGKYKAMFTENVNQTGPGVTINVAPRQRPQFAPGGPIVAEAIPDTHEAENGQQEPTQEPTGQKGAPLAPPTPQKGARVEGGEGEKGGQ